MKPDPAIDKIREVRRKISAEFGHDPRRLMAHYREMEAQLHAQGKYRFLEPSEPEPEQAVLNDRLKKK
jgi:hypothetical protein